MPTGCENESTARLASSRVQVALIVAALAAAGLGGAALASIGDDPAVSSSSTDAATTPASSPVTRAPSTTAPKFIIPADTSPPRTDNGVNPFGGNSPEDKRMPDVVCMNLQDAQNEIQDHGVFFSRSIDATGDGRRQILDRNWIVVAQDPEAGEPIGEADAVLSVVKTDEPNDCS